MDSKPKIDLSDVFDEPDRRRFLSKFDSLVRHLSRNSLEDDCCRRAGGQCHDINQIVSIITENLIRLVEGNDFKFENSLYSLPWVNYLLESGSQLNQLNQDIFAKLLLEYVQIFPNKCDKFVENFLFILRGHKDGGDDPNISEQELRLFSHLKLTIGSLLKNIRNFERILTTALKKRFPFYHNANIHEFVCYIYNLVNIAELMSHESTYDMLNFLFTHLLQVDMKQFFDELHDNVNKENIMFEFEDINTTSLTTAIVESTVTDERIKKFKVLDASLNLIFEYLDTKLKDNLDEEQKEKSEQLLEIFTSIFFQRLLISDCVHLQYILFYLCSRSRPYCDAFVNDLWTISTSTTDSLQIREGSFSFLVSLILQARFVPMNTVFSFLKILVQWLNSHLDAKQHSESEAVTDSDVMYYNICIGFCRLFCTFHTDLERIQIECLKNMDMKRALMNVQMNPMQFFKSELRDHFITLATHYRIGYNSNGHDIRPRPLSKISPTHRDHLPSFGMIKLASVKARIVSQVRNIDAISDGAFNTSGDGLRSPSRGGHRGMGMRSSMMNTPSHQFDGYSSKGIMASGRRTPYGMKMVATSPGTNTSDDAMYSSPNSFTPSSTSMIMNAMLSDMEAME